MKKKFSLFFDKMRQKLFEWRFESEIYGPIFQQVNQEKQSDYPFDSRKELVKTMIRGELDAKLHLATIERQADFMAKAYGEAFRYIMYRDLNKRLHNYLELAQRRIPARCRDASLAS